MNTHAAFLKSVIPGEKDLRLAAGSELYCQQRLDARLALSPCREGYVRELTAEELR
jgi:hypothetical protein